ncbi:MAG TPA: helix-turn-helix transcriptional regulator [Gammaproteobacteria bacterium]|nr:helix-turn-helix transcriptional regulator [Gammaproteobacteria bacterium]
MKVERKDIISRREQIVDSLESKEYRDAFVENAINIGIPFQIKGMRDLRGWTQEHLAELCNKPQPQISRLESPGYGSFTLKTLRELASAFDVGLLVAFVPFSLLADRAACFSTRELEVPDFGSDLGLRPAGESAESNVVPIFKANTYNFRGLTDYTPSIPRADVGIATQQPFTLDSTPADILSEAQNA